MQQLQLHFVAWQWLLVSFPSFVSFLLPLSLSSACYKQKFNLLTLFLNNTVDDLVNTFRCAFLLLHSPSLQGDMLAWDSWFLPKESQKANLQGPVCEIIVNGTQLIRDANCMMGIKDLRRSFKQRTLDSIWWRRGISQGVEKMSSDLCNTMAAERYIEVHGCELIKTSNSRTTKS